MVDGNRSPGGIWATQWMALAYVLLLAVNVWLLWFLPEAPPSEKVSFVLALIGLYSLALNFSSGSGLTETFPGWLDQATSPSVRDFTASAFRVTGLAFFSAGLFIRGFPPPMLARLRFVAVVLAIPLWLVVVVVTLVVSVAYLVVVVPLAYAAYLFASIALDAIESAPADSDDAQVARPIQEAVSAHRAQLRTLVVGVPATVLGIGTTAYSFFP